VPEAVSSRRILHCDMDAFYAAVHMRDDPSLRSRPVVVGGDPAGRGVVAAASYEARAFGIHSAMPAARALRLCPEAVFLRPDFRRYVAESEKILAIFRDYSPVARGIDDRPVRTDHVRKSLGTERTFPRNITDLHAIDDILSEMAAEVASGLEHRRLAAATITVKVRYPDFATHTRSMSLPVPTAAAPVIASCARLLVRRTEAAAHAVRLLGVSASGLIPCDHEQLALFDPTPAHTGDRG
jgi:nucleotidyltransferase/DNA polymerase involved in DNA repair